ncbi:MAG: EamA family transporter [Candidatus Gracilibacteria bacterium]|jgi:uncharacterized membrane protein
MSLAAILLVLLSAVLLTFRDFQTKKSQDKQVFIWWISFLSLFLFIPFGAYFYWKDGVDPRFLLIPLAAGFVHCAYWIFYSRAYDHGDLSQVFPIIRSTPLLVLLFGTFFLHEQITPIGVVGILLTSLGVYCINLTSLSFRAFLKPFSGLFKDIHIQFAFLALLMTGVYAVVDKIGIGHMNPMTYAAVQCGFATLLFSFYMVAIGKWKLVRTFWKKERSYILSSGFLTAFNYPLTLFAMSLSAVSYVMSFRQVGVVLAVLAGGHLLKEKHFGIRLGASLMIFAGVLLIALA